MSKVPTPDNPIPIEEQTKIITLDGSEDWVVMRKEDYMKNTKEYLVTLLMKSDEVMEKLKNENTDLYKQLGEKKFDEFLHIEYLQTKEQLAYEKDMRGKLEYTLHETQQLLDRYKHIVDRLGGSNE